MEGNREKRVNIHGGESFRLADRRKQVQVAHYSFLNNRAVEKASVVYLTIVYVIFCLRLFIANRFLVEHACY